MLRKTNISITLIGIIALFLVNPALNAQVNAGNDTTSCNGSAYLYAVPPGGVWTTSGNASIVSPSSQSTTVNNLEQGLNVFTYTFSGQSDQINVTNNQVFATATTDRADNCLSTVNLIGSNIPSGGSGAWTLKFPAPGVVIQNPSNSTTSATNLPFGTSIFTWTVNSSGCSASDEISILNNTPENDDGTDQAGCTGTFYIDAEAPPSGGSGMWSQLSGPGTVSFSNPVNPGVTITAPLGQSIVRWRLSYNGCISDKDFTLINNLPNPDAGQNQQLCSATATLNASALLTGELGNWTVIDPQSEIISNPNIPGTLVSNLKQGTTTFIWTVDNGICTATDSVQLINNLPFVYAGKDTTICTSTYNLLANNPVSATGIWSCSDPSVVFGNVSSFNSSVSNLSNGSYTFTWTVNNGLCPASDQVLVHSNYVSISAGNSSSGCSDVLALNATPVPPGGNGLWTVIHGNADIGDPLSNITTALNLSENVRLRWTINSGGCIYSNEIEYHNQLPTLAVTQEDKAVCDNFTTITANVPSAANNETGLWTLVGGSGNVIIDQKSLFQTAVSNLDPGINTFRWTISNPYCSSSDILIITNNRITTNAGPDQDICSTTTILSAGNEGGSGYWTTTSGTAIITDSTNPSTGVSGLSYGQHTFKWTRIDNGCSATDEVLVNNNMPIDANAGPDHIVCETTASLNAVSPGIGIGLWTKVLGNAHIVDQNFNKSSVTGLSPGINTFRWTVSNLDCSFQDEVNITNNQITANAGADQTICNTASALLTGSEPGAGQNGTWTIAGGSGTFTNPSLYQTEVKMLVKGSNTFRWTVSDGYCSSSDYVVITNNTPDSAKVASDKIICSGSTQINAVSVSNGTGMWSVKQGSGLIENPLNYSTNVNGIGEGVNIYTWTVTKNGCSLSADQTVTNNSVTAGIPISVMQVCRASNDTVLVATETTGSGIWAYWTKISAGAATIEDPSNRITRVSGLANGEIRFRWTVQNINCSAFDEIIVVNDYYAASASAVGSAEVCTNSASVIGNPGPPGAVTYWIANQPQVSFSNPSSVSTSVNNLPSGQTIVRWTISNNGCGSSSDLTLTNYTITTDAGENISGCSPTAVLAAQSLESGQTGYWTANNIAVIFENSLSPITAVSNAPAGNSLLTWTIQANGCSASDFMVLTNNSFTISAGNDQIVCSTSATLEGSDPFTGTGYWTVLEGSAIINNSASKVTTVNNLKNGNNVFRWTVSRNSCFATDEITVVNDLYLADILPSSDVCADSSYLQAVYPPDGSGASGSWVVLSGGGIFDNPASAETWVRNMDLGQNQFRWTVTKGSCTSFKNITVNNNTINILAGVDYSTCQNSGTLFATPLSSTGTGMWTGPPGVTITNPESPGTDVLNLARGPNNFTWTVTDKGCTGSSNVTVTNHSFDANAGEDITVQVPSAVLGAELPDPAATGSWQIIYGNATFSDIHSPTSSVTDLIQGINGFRWNVTWNTCTAYDDVLVIFNVAEANAGSDKVSCLSTATMNAQTPPYGTGTWSVIQGGGTFQNVNLPNTQVTNIPQGTSIYRWTVVAFGIVAYDDVSITNNSFYINAGIDQATCNSYIDLNGEDPGTGTGSWYILQGDGTFTNNYIPNPTVSGLAVGINSFVWQVSRNGCSTRDTVNITRHQPPTLANAGADAVVCNKNDYILVGNAPSSGTGRWSSENSFLLFDNPQNITTTVRNLSYGPNSIWWTISTNYCQSADEVIVSSYNTLQLTLQPESQNLSMGSTLSLHIETTGGAKSYQWKKDGVNLSDVGRISGSTSQTLQIGNMQMSDAGNYTCAVIGYCNNVTSNTASIGVLTSVEQITTDQIRVFPNPTGGMITLEYDYKPGSTLIIHDLKGNKMFEKVLISRREIIDLGSLSSGSYILSVNSGSNTYRSRVIVQK